MKKVLLIGQNGQVTTYLQRVLKGNYQLVVAGREQLDLVKVGDIQAVLRTVAPDLIVNPAAYTAVDQAEQEQELAFTINCDAAAEIADYCAQTATPLIHFSTDYVFAGDADTPYTEQDSPAPTGVYGQSKLAGEEAILKSGAPALILRTSWVYSTHGKNFYKTMLSLSESRNELSVVADQIGAPTYAGSIADATKKIIDQILEQDGIAAEQIGVYHLSCQGQTSWADFADEIFARHQIAVTVNSIPSSDYPTPAKRPAYSVLDGTKLLTTFAVSLPDWQLALQACVSE